MNLNSRSWGDFKLGDIFHIKKGKRLTSAEQTEGMTPYIGAIESNNGVSNKIGQSPIHDGNTISLSYNGSVGEAFYQPTAFWATDDVNVLYFKKSNKHIFNQHIGMFICTILRQEKYRFSYGRKWTLENMRNSIISLPIKDNGSPDWDFMELYIKSLHHKPLTTKNSPNKNCDLQISEWKEFCLDELFTIKKAYAYNKDTLPVSDKKSDERIRCITRTTMNCGCDYIAELSPNLKVEDGNALTIGGEGGICFYQNENFVCGTNVTVLRGEYINKYTGIFICTVINYYSKGRFSYGRAFNKGQIERSIIKLPALESGEPDWGLMENYIKALPYGDRL